GGRGGPADGAGPDRVPAGARAGTDVPRARLPQRPGGARRAVPGRGGATGGGGHPRLAQGPRPQDLTGGQGGAQGRGARLSPETGTPVAVRALTGPNAAADELCAALRGDCHLHSDWSDGGSPIELMARTAARLGHDWAVLTDHSPRLTVARGLSADRLREQLDVVAALNERLAPFRLLTGIEVDILTDGSLDQEPELLDRLDLVVASVHSKLRMDARPMTRRMVAAVSDPRVDVLGHCTGRLLGGKRPESAFDAAEVFAACAESGTAVEINCRPERLDPPRRLLREAVQAGTFFSVDTDAHAPGQLDWQINGCARAVECGVPKERIINTWTARQLGEWTRTRKPPGG
ncbi:LOW QUALITY PROTEIN: X family DNA polymerase, partial [Streptomyces himastatinicus ATCC 53653]